MDGSIRHRAAAVLLVSVAFCAISFAYSFVGFLSPQPPNPLYQYGRSFLDTLVEVGGHFLFGIAAALPLIQWELVLAGGMFAVLIDADHILSELGLPVGGYGRPDHSFLYVLLSAVLFYFIGKKAGLGGHQVALVVIVAVLSHLSYDIFNSSGVGASFPILIPLHFGLIPFPYWSWPVFEITALLLASITLPMTLKRQHGR